MRAVSLALVVVGCVPSRSAVFGPVDREAQQRLGVTVAWGTDPNTEAAIDKLLAQPIDLDAAVRIALARNQRLQARYEELGIAASAVADATVLPATDVDFDYKRAFDDSGGESELTVVQDLLSLIQIGQRRDAAHAELDASRARAVAATVELAVGVEMAFYDHVAAQQDLELVQTALEAAVASAELIERQHAAGNTTDLVLVREQEQRERVRVEVARAEQRVADTRAALGASLGLRVDQRWSATGRLPDVPATAPALDDLDRVATQSNLDSVALRAEADAAGARRRYAVVRAFVPTFGAGVAVARRDGGDWEAGPALRIGIPLFDQQQGPRARARAEEHRARRELAATQVELGIEVDAARGRLQRAFAEARRLADVVLPLRKRVLDETVLHYNAMNATPFELLVAKRDMVDVGRQLIDAQRRYWSAVAQTKALRRGGRAHAAENEIPGITPGRIEEGHR